MDTNGKVELARWESPNGKVRAHYRIKMTGEDTFEHSYIIHDNPTDPRRPMVWARDMSKWTLERFVVSIELLGDNDQWTTRPFTWDVLKELTGAHADGGWGELAWKIWKEVVQQTADNLDALKKTLIVPSEPSSSGATPPPAEPSRT